MELDQLGRYQIVGRIGEGAMGVVYRAHDPLLDRVVAIKTIKLDLTPAEQDEFEKRFFREARSAGRLNHPSIVTVYDAGKSGDTAYIAMEYLEGQDLRQFMTRDRELDVDWVVDLVAKVADGLEYAHQAGVVHRDIKPANIVVLDHGGIKIADFGIAQLQTGSKTMTGMVLGTPKYMSPEQIVGDGVDGRSDIFSLGTVLYQLLTQVAPFDAETLTTIMYRVLYEPARIPEALARSLPRGLLHVLARSLAKKREDRYPRALEMAQDLRRYRELAAQFPGDDPGHCEAIGWSLGGITLGAYLDPQEGRVPLDPEERARRDRAYCETQPLDGGFRTYLRPEELEARARELGLGGAIGEQTIALDVMPRTARLGPLPDAGPDADNPVAVTEPTGPEAKPAPQPVPPSSPEPAPAVAAKPAGEKKGAGSSPAKTAPQPKPTAKPQSSGKGAGGKTATAPSAKPASSLGQPGKAGRRARVMLFLGLLAGLLILATLLLHRNPAPETPKANPVETAGAPPGETPAPSTPSPPEPHAAPGQPVLEAPQAGSVTPATTPGPVGTEGTSPVAAAGSPATPPAPPAPPAKTGINVAVSPWGEVWVDGVNRGVSPPLTVLPLSPGHHRVEIRNGDAPAGIQEFDLKEGETRRLRHKF